MAASGRIWAGEAEWPRRPPPGVLGLPGFQGAIPGPRERTGSAQKQEKKKAPQILDGLTPLHTTKRRASQERRASGAVA